jgi:hypothetical protein
VDHVDRVGDLAQIENDAVVEDAAAKPEEPAVAKTSSPIGKFRAKLTL